MQEPLHPHARRRRARGGVFLIGVLGGLLLLFLFRLQVLGHADWSLRARANHLRQLPVPATRGTIYDRTGRILADAVPGYVLGVLPGPRDSLRSTLRRLQPLLEITPAEAARRLDEPRLTGGPIVLDEDADFATVSALEERRASFPDVYVEMRPRRRYPGGPALAHVLGYVAEAGREELESRNPGDDRSGGDALMGKAGIERQYQNLLAGRNGVRYVEVDARGRVVGDFASPAEVKPRPGRNLHLNLDLELQRWIHRIFPDSLSGAVVALEVADGGVLALYSAPTYDPGTFVGGISEAAWDSLTSSPARPLYDRATRGLYAPASTWKPATAAIGLELGVVDADEHMPEPCTGAFRWGGRVWHCWDREGHGYNTLAEAIGNSCDVYFYQLGLRIGLDRLLTRTAALGFTQATGIDLPRESRGTFPRDRSFWRERFGYRPRESEVLSLAIGQGPNVQTPLRVAQFYLALARDGTAPRPTLARDASPDPVWDLGVSPGTLESIREGLRKVTAPDGTAHLTATLEHFALWGKTGTGQNTASLSGRGKEDAWFAGVAGPFDGAPEIVVVAVVEEGGSGSAVAAPIVAKAADLYLRRKHGIPLDTIQTLGEWVRNRGWPEWHRERFGESE